MNNIEQLLQELGITKAQLADMMGTSRQNINSLLKNPTTSKLELIAKALNVPLWRLFATPEEVERDANLTPKSMVICPNCGQKILLNPTIDESN